MGVARSIAERRHATSGLAVPEEWLLRDLGVTENASGIRVTPESALKLAAVWGCVRVLSEGVGALPLFLYQRLDPRGKRRATEHRVFRLLHTQPNPRMTSTTFREISMAHLVLWGNAYIEVERTKAGQVIALWPLLPDRTSVRIKNGVKSIVSRPDHVKEYVLSPGNYIHITGLGFDGVQGMSPIAYHRQAIGLGLAAEKFGARFYGTGAHPGGVLEYEGKFENPAAKLAFREQWEEVHGSVENSHRVAILEDGMAWKQTAIPPDDAQFIETRVHQVREIARIFGVPPNMLADLADATYSNVEHENLRFVIQTLTPWLVRWEQALLTGLFPESQQAQYVIEFLITAMVRGDLKTRYEAYVQARQNGWMSANDVRELENLNPVDGGDTYMVPMNMVPADSLMLPPPEPEPPQAGPVEEPEAGDDDGERAVREQRSLAQRRRETAASVPAFLAAAERISRRETEAIRRLARRHLQTTRASRSARSFDQALSSFYTGHQEYAQRQIEPVLEQLGSSIYATAQDEVADTSTQDAGPFAREYGETFAYRHCEGNREQITALVRDTDPEQQGDAVLRRMDEWDETQADKMAARESVQSSNAFAKAVWIAVGVTEITWRANSDACPLCQSINGSTVSIDRSFLVPGDSIAPGGVTPLTVHQRFGHPPLHQGCQCGIGPG